ncbi:MAG: hypothetical protein CL824_02155 [Crocinitomicaceae bacterium]|nr:hypothetical protein [Crocinitomicaceae bacterium]
MKHIFYFFLLFNLFATYSQVTDDFSDGDFNSNPTWSGNTSEFIVNNNQELQLNSSGSSTSYLSLNNNLSNIDDKEWRIWVKQSFSPSGSNNGRIFLCSDNSDLSNASNGYFIQLGEAGSNDAIRLFKLDNNVSSEICSGSNAQIATSFDISLKIIRNTNGDWSVYADLSGGQNYSFLCSSNDGSNLFGSFSGVLCNYTSSNSTKFYFDDVFIGDEQVDLTPPNILSVNVANSNTLDILFDEAVESTSAENTSNYSISPAISITGALRDGGNFSIVHLSLATPLINGSSYTLTTSNISDISGNSMNSQQIDFSYLISDTPLKGDIIINEFFADPSPSVGLPDEEFIEVYNKSNKIFNLDGWLIGDASSEGTISEKWILPGEIVVLCSNSDTSLFNHSVGVSSFPSLNNSSDDIVLKYSNGLTIDHISYTDEWYKDEAKKDGGYSIELINPNDPCSDIDNWTASNWPTGGTPGEINSVYNTTPDVSAAQISSLIAMTPNFLEITFNESMDSLSLMNAPMTFSPSLSIQNKYVTSSFSKLFTLEFNETLNPSELYSINITGTEDCWQNSNSLSGFFTLPEEADSGDVVINEIMSNPLTGGSDWIEIFNNSNKVIDLINWGFSNFDDDTISNNKLIANHFILNPNEYAVIGQDSNFVLNNYPFSQIGTFINSDLPTYSNDSGTVYLVYNNQVYDKVSYKPDWHFLLLDSEDGVSLERINPNSESNTPNNWHSAAESYGFASPGIKNSQYVPIVNNGSLSLTNEVISPDNDGFEDVLIVNYKMSESGLLGNAKIYDDRGRPIKTIFQNELLGTENSFYWDGLKDDGTKTSIGTYIIIFEAFSTNGNLIYTQKKAFTLAGKL